MRLRYLATFGSLILLLSGCYLPISGRVIDSETNQPIEGAVVLVEWMKTKGYGLTYTESYKVAEALSDKDGNFELPGCYSPLVNEPNVTIYKKGYVAWNNMVVFPNYEKRLDYQWRNKELYKLQIFKSSYSMNKHMSFIEDLVMSGKLEKKKRIINAIKWEEEKAFEERRMKK